MRCLVVSEALMIENYHNGRVLFIPPRLPITRRIPRFPASNLLLCPPCCTSPFLSLSFPSSQFSLCMFEFESYSFHSYMKAWSTQLLSCLFLLHFVVCLKPNFFLILHSLIYSPPFFVVVVSYHFVYFNLGIYITFRERGRSIQLHW